MAASGLATALAVMIPVSLLIGVISQMLPSNAQPFATPSLGETVAAGALGLVHLALGITIIVLALIWVYRVVKNAQVHLGAHDLSLGWAVGCWFIPVAHAILPIFPILKTWRASRAGGSGVPVTWGILWAVSVLMSYGMVIVGMIWGISMAAELANGTPEELEAVQMPVAIQVATWINVVLNVAAGVLFVVLVLGLSRAQQRLVPAAGRVAVAPAFR